MGLFDLEDLKPQKDTEGVGALILRRRQQILVHSALYYRMSENLVEDHVYDSWGKELVKLTRANQEIADATKYAKEFKNYGDGDCYSGYDLDYRQAHILQKAEQLLRYRDKKEEDITK